MADDPERPSLWRTLWSWSAYVMPHARRYYIVVYAGLSVALLVLFVLTGVWTPLALALGGLGAMAATAWREARYRARHPAARPASGRSRLEALWPPSKDPDDYW